MIAGLSSLSTGQRWALAAAVLTGMAAGLGAFTFGFARGYAYLTNDPAACANCHVMSEHYSAWQKASHRSVATCNDCHTPHNFAGKYYVKAKNGFWHSFYFTVGGYPDPLRITEGNRRVTEAACRHCHTEITEAIDHGPGTVAGGRHGRDSSGTRIAPSAHAAGHSGEAISCVRCHKYVGHWVR